MTNNEDIKWLYGKLIGQGYDIGTEEEFTSSLSNGDDRDWYYNKAIKMGLDVGSKDEFDSLFAPQEPTATPDVAAETPETPQAPTAPTAPKVGSLNWYTAKNAGDAIKNVADNSVLASATKAKNTEATDNLAKVKGTADVAQNTQELIHTTPIESKALELAQFRAKNKAMFDNMAQRTADMGEYYTKAGANVGKVVETAPEYNAETGEFETQYITPTLNREENKAIADAEAREYKQMQKDVAMYNKYFTETNMTTAAQLRSKRARLADVERKISERIESLQAEQEKLSGGVMGFINELGRGSAGRGIAKGVYTQDDETAFALDEEYKTLRAIKSQLEEQIQKLENKQDNEQNGTQPVFDFLKGTAQNLFAKNTFDFGRNALNNSRASLNISDKIARGEELTDAEDQLIYEQFANQLADEYIGNLGKGLQFGHMTGDIAGFAIDMALMGPSGSGGGAIAKGLANSLAKRLGVKTTEGLAKKLVERGLFATIKNKGAVGKLLSEVGIANTSAITATRALGIGAEYLAIKSPIMTVTQQGQKAAGKIIDTKLGDVELDYNTGELRYANDKGFGEATYEALGDQIIENASEMIGGHLPGISNVTRLGSRGLTASVLRATREGAGTVISKVNQFLGKVGVHSVFDEISEEYIGQAWRTMFGLESAKDQYGNNNFLNAEFHSDIWCGMGASIGFMHGIGLTVGYGAKGVSKVMSGVEYQRLKHQVNKASAYASSIIPAEQWDNLQTLIDAADNVEISNVAEQIAQNKDLTDRQKDAAMNYINRLMIMRGFNLAKVFTDKAGVTMDADTEAVNQSYADGYESNDAQEMSDARKAVEVEEAKLRSALSGIDQEGVNAIMADVIADPVTAMQRAEDEALRDAIADYANAKAVYDGMQQRVADDIDTQIAVSDATIDRRTNRNTGKVQSVTLKNDKKVYVVGGTLNATENGSVDFEHSDESIVVMDETGSLEYSSPKNVLSIDNEIDPAEEKAISAEAIRQQAQAQAEANMSGKLTFTAGEQVNLKQKDGTFLNGTIVGPYAEEGKVFSGLVEVETQDGTKLPFEADVLQTWADEARQARIEQFDAERSAERDAIDAQRAELNAKALVAEFNQDDVFTIDVNGEDMSGTVLAPINDDGLVEVLFNTPQGEVTQMMTPDVLNVLLTSYNGVSLVAEESPVSEETTTLPEVEANKVPEVMEAPQSAFDRVPKDANGEPMYEAVDAETAWDAIVEQTQGDVAMAQTVANDMVKDKEKALKAAQNAKSKGGATIAEKIASEQERKANIQNAEQELAIWQAIASVPETRQQAMAQAQAQAEAERIRQIKEAEEKAKAEAEALKAQQEADERAKAEALNGVPDMVDDTPQAARERGFRRYNGHKYNRQEPIEHEQGKDVEIKFSDSNIVPGHVAVIDVAKLQPSHITGVRNPLHFIDEAQPKERNDDASVFASRQIAAKIRPEEITTSVTAYTGAPTVNTRGEVIQGNNRSEALRLMWESEKAQAQKYKQYLIDHASEFGLTPEQIEAMEQPVLVNMVDVTDEQAIELGQFVAQDTESGGIERIKPKNAMQKMGDDMRVFANMLLRSADEEMSITALIDANGEQVLEWMSKKGYITATQYQSAFDTRGNITAEAKNDLKGIMYQSIFKGGSTQLEEMFNTLPAKAQKAILATAFRDFDSPNAERMIDEIQNSIRAYYALSLDKVFAEAKNAKDVRIAVEAWKRQTQMDDVSGEAYLPAEKFSNFALHLATMYKGNTQKLIQGTFNQLFDLIQGTQEENLFEKPDNTPRTLAEAIKEVLNIDYNGQSGSNVLGVNPQTSQSGRQGSEGDTASRERAESTEQSADSAGGIDGDSRGIRSESEDRASQSEENATEIKSSMSANEAIDFVADMELIADVAPEIDLTIENWDALFGESGTINTPIGEVKMGENQFAKLMRQGREGKLGMIKPTLENPHAIVEEASEAKEGDTTERASSYIFIRSFKKADGSRFYYVTSITVSKDGREVVVSSQEKSRNKILRLLQEGSVIWRTPKDATTSSAERQGLDYEQPNKAETAPKGSGITPQSTSSESKDTTSSQNNNEIEDKNVQPTIGEQIQAAEAEVNINPTEAQKEVSFSIREGNVASNTIATEVAVGMLKDAGVEVVEATDAMAEAVLAKGGVMSMDSAPFYSNAKKAVLDIKQDKATPQQWVAMLKKNGGLKAGEDAWLGLESWLSGQTGSVTKQEIIDYIDEHAIEIEEVNYGESEVSQFEDSDIYNEWAELGGDEDAFNEMIERYGDDFEMAFLYDEGQLYVADEDAASFFIDKGAETINETRLSYTTEGLTDNREIALTVPTIEPYNEDDEIHFGDAGNGRAIAWIRFGDTKDANGNDVLVIDEIQSVRHQDGREKGYRNEEIIALENRINSLHEKMYGEGLAPEEYRELTRLREEQREIIINANPELKAESEKVKELEKEYEALKKDNQSKLDSEGVELARLQTLQEDARSIAEYDRIEKEIQDIKDAADKRKAELNEFFNVTIGNAYDKLHKGIRNDLSNQVYGVPVAPFEKNWHELAMKRMLRYAAENGYDKVAWTTGAQQAARYDMRQQVDNIQVEENNIEEFNDGTPIAKNITINTPRGNKIRYQADAEGNIRGGEYGGKNLKDVVGKELAEKIMQPGSFTIEEEGLAIGGEGMKGFYDKMLPSFVNKYTKKWGAKVGEVTMPSLEEGYQTMHSVDVTPQMKEDVMKGQPMFLRTPNGTVYGWTQGGKVFLTKEGMNAETPIHEYTHLWDKMVQQKNPELWNRGKELLKQTPTWNEVINDANYANIAHDEDAVASEVHSRLSGENGAKVLERMIKDARKDGAMAVAKAASITERIKEWIKDMFAALKETLSAWSKQDLADLSIEDFNNLTLRDLAEGVNPNDYVTEKGDVQFMGSRVDKRMADISNYFNGRTLSAEQQAVVDVYSGKSNNLPISINRADSNIKVVMRQGVEQKAGAKHSLFRHYGTNVGVITSEDIILIPEIFANGERVKKQHGNTTMYEYKQTINGVKYTVLTEVNNRGAEIFDDYYTDRSKVARSSNTQLSAQADSNLASQHKVTQNSANSNSIATNQDISFSIVDSVAEMVEDAKGANEEQLGAKQNAIAALGGDLGKLRSAMARQRKYDKFTIGIITRMAKEMLDNGMLGEMSHYAVKRLLGAIERVHGKQDVSKEVNSLISIMIDTQLQNCAASMAKMLKVKGSKVNATGVQVQGVLDADGEAMVKAFKRAIKMQKEDIEERLTEVENRMQNANEVVANDAKNEYYGLQLALQYMEEIKGSKAEEVSLRRSLEDAKADRDAGMMTQEGYRQYVKSVEDAIQQNKMERAEAYRTIMAQLGGLMGESIERAKAWREAEAERVNNIHHYANSDMEGRKTNEHRKDTFAQKVMSFGLVKILLSPYATFDQMLRMFGKKNVRGEGYLYRHFMDGWMRSTENEYTGYRDALKELDAKAKEMFGDKAMRWGHLIKEGNMPSNITVDFWDGGEIRPHTLTLGNLLYIYMVNKMADGQMKLRHMGITEEQVDAITRELDPEYIALADWLQETFLTEKREKYNEVHKRMFGTSMASIDNYFPLKILANARTEKVDVGEETPENNLPSTATGSIIKRKKNNTALDVMGTNAFAVILDHLNDMEHWAAFAEFNRDLNTLLSYKRFRNQVLNMNSTYGGGKELWQKFKDACAIAAGSYRAKTDPLDAAALKIAKGASAAKVAWRTFTALKQFSSLPAFVQDANAITMAKNMANPYKAWNWTMQNLPIAEKRWKSMVAGDAKLLQTMKDWDNWQSRISEVSTRYGMLPNAFVDAVSVSIGAYSVYETAKKRYLRYGYSEEQAEQKAKNDATTAFNQTQQSGETAYLSAMQVDRTWLSTMLSVFRNNAFAFGRQLHDAFRGLGRSFNPNAIEFMTKQMMRQGLSEEQAEKAAEKEIGKSRRRDLVRLFLYGGGLTMLWEIMSAMPYLLFGDDDDEKDEIIQTSVEKSLLAGFDGLAGGDGVILGLQWALYGEGKLEYAFRKDMPFISDVESMIRKFSSDELAALNDLANIVVQWFAGVNPQVMWDAMAGVWDYCEGDAQTAREVSMLMMNILACPQSQRDKVYLDEIDLSVAEASKLTPEQIAERYARYKVRRTRGVFGILSEKNNTDSVLLRHKNKSLKLSKNAIGERLATDSTKALLEEYDAINERKREINKLREDMPEEEWMKLNNEFSYSYNRGKHKRIGNYKKEMKDLTNRWLKTRSREEADSLVNEMFNVRNKMLQDIPKFDKAYQEWKEREEE